MSGDDIVVLLSKAADAPVSLRDKLIALFNFEDDARPDAAVGIEVYGTGQPEHLVDAILDVVAEHVKAGSA